MKSKFLSAVCVGLITISSTVWGMEMSGESHVHPKSTVVSENTIHATGTVKAIAENHESVRIFHNPIPELRWPSMLMPFDVIDHELTHPLSVGDRVEFEFIQKDGKNIIVRMKKQ
jgi:Cu(I)/Ag(I) efflux system protein CusF